MTQILQTDEIPSLSNLEKYSLPTKSSDHILRHFDDVDLEDGPLLRATIKEYEGRTVMMKKNLKRILKAATAIVEARNQLLEQDKLFNDALKETSFLEPLFTHYLDNTWQQLHEQQERLSFCMQNLLIDPLQKLYDMDIKTIDSKRKQFDDCSKEYYSNLSKYLSIKSPNTSMIMTKDKRIVKAESEFLAKKTEFDVVRFEYYSFLTDLHGGKKEQEVLYHLLNHYEKQYSYYQSITKTLQPHKFGLDQLAALIAEASREQKMVNQERTQKRRLLMAQQITRGCMTDDLKRSEKRISLNTIISPPLPSLSNTPITQNKFKGIRDLEQRDQQAIENNERKKEGFLFATTKPLKTNNLSVYDNLHWHKYWCVVSGGQLHEYSKWKKHLESNIEPINLRFATVREATTMDRRFCFEVITPKLRRMYQATSSEELSNWLITINNAISSLLNGVGSCNDLANNQLINRPSMNWIHGKSISGALTGITAAAKDKYFKKRQQKNAYGSNNNLAVTPTPVYQQTFKHMQSFELSNNNIELLDELRKDLSNTICADCSAKNPDWCSLNLGILICIECSGIHRSLGTHISKVRSLTLDKTIFTPDIIHLLKSIGNKVSNNVWEAKLMDTNEIMKPGPLDSREIKLKYIQYKYVQRVFVDKPNSGINTMNLLFNAIKNNDISNALYAIAAGADVNEPFVTPISSIHLFPKEKKEPYVIKLPLLDKNGNEFPGQTMEYTLPISTPEWADDKLMIRYALHLSLLYPDTTYSFDHSRSSTYSSLRSEDSDNSEDFVDSSTIIKQQRHRVFVMTEFLFQNGADCSIQDIHSGQSLGEIIGLGNLVDDEAIAYLNMKNGLRGQSPIIRMPYIH